MHKFTDQEVQALEEIYDEKPLIDAEIERLRARKSAYSARELAKQFECSADAIRYVWRRHEKQKRGAA